MVIKRPPTASRSSRCCGTLATEPLSTMASKRSLPAKGLAPSATRTSTFNTPAWRSLWLAVAANSGMHSKLSTLRPWRASSAAMKPEPVPISKILSSGWICRSCSMRASRRGASMYWPCPRGISMSAKARAWCAVGTNASRCTSAKSDRTSASSTFQGRICCSIMLKRAWATSERFMAGLSGARFKEGRFYRSSGAGAVASGPGKPRIRRTH